MAPDDSTRCQRCRSHTNDLSDDGANPPFPLCPYCQSALLGNVTIINKPVKKNKQGPKARRTTPSKAKSFWRKRQEVKGR
jgi:hypothetical protein